MLKNIVFFYVFSENKFGEVVAGVGPAAQVLIWSIWRSARIPPKETVNEFWSDAKPSIFIVFLLH